MTIRRKIASSARKPSGRNVSLAISRAATGAIQTSARTVFYHGRKPLSMPSAAKKASAIPSTMKS
jgi:hypothetical protein